MFARALAVVLVLSACSGSAPAAPEGSIAFLRAIGSSDPDSQQALLDELRAQGFVEGVNLTIFARDPEEVHVERADVIASVNGWVEGGVDVIFAQSSSGAAIASEAAPSTPVVFVTNDPAAVGLVADEARPEANLTGVTFRVPADRTLEFARRAIPDFDRFGYLYPSQDPASEPHRQAVATAAGELDVRILEGSFEDESEIPGLVAGLRRRGADGLFMANAPTAVRAAGAIAAAAATEGLPVIANTTFASFALVVLEPDVDELLRQVGRQIGRLLSGDAVADIPVEDPRRYRLVLNAAAARLHGIEFAPALVREASEVTG